MKLTHVFFALVLGFSLLSCATAGSQQGGGDYESMLAEAEKAYASIDKAGGAWRDTGDMIESAKKEAGSGNTAKAYELASKAYEQAKMAAEQYESEKKAGPWLF